MSEATDNRQSGAPPEGSDEALARLLRIAGPRPDIPAALERRVEARVRSEWRQATRRQRQKRVFRWAAPLALAASLLLALTLSWQPPAAPPQPVIGSVARVDAGTAGAGLPAAGSSVRVGQTLSTSAAQSLSVTLRDGTSLRLAPGSTLTVEAADEFRLHAGELYADTGPPVYSSRALTVHTPVALVTDVGTQFLVRYQDGERLRVAVREGRVDVAEGDTVHSAVAGELLHLEPGSTPAIETVAPHAALWGWAAAIAPEFEIENRTLMDFLKWAARETGRELVFADDERRMAAMRTVLHGSIDGFAPDEALTSVLATSGFVYRLTPESIVIESLTLAEERY